MLWMLNNWILGWPQPRYTWMKVRVRYETEKAVLVVCEDRKVWLPKSRIGKVKFKKGQFWLYVLECYGAKTIF